MSTSGSGLLEDLLEQTQAGNYGESSRRVSEDKSDFSGFNQWSDSSSMNMSSGNWFLFFFCFAGIFSAIRFIDLQTHQFPLICLLL